MRRFLVIGGSKGIGQAVVKTLRKDYPEAEVMESSRSGANELDLAWQAPEVEGRVSALLLELCGPEGGLDGLVLSAGRGAYVRRYFAPQEMYDLFRVNVYGRILAYRAAFRWLARGDGSAVFLGSTVAQEGAKGLELYGASLAANEGFVRSEAKRARRHGVRVNVLAPGWVNTEMTKEMREDYREAAAAWMPCGRMLEPEEVAVQVGDLLVSHETGNVVRYLGEDLI